MLKVLIFPLIKLLCDENLEMVGTKRDGVDEASKLGGFLLEEEGKSMHVRIATWSGRTGVVV